MTNSDAFTSISEQADHRLLAMKAVDIDRLDEILHPSLIYIHSSARVDGKSSFIRSISAGDLDYHGFLATEISFLEIAPDVVVRTGVLETSVTAKGRKLSLDNRFIETWVCHDGMWRMISWQSTPRTKPTP